jgi:hypothetical protein
MPPKRKLNDSIGEEKVYSVDKLNECKLKLDIPLEMVNDINKELVKNHEISGIILCNDSNQVVGVNKTKGNADSVYTPNNVINFHTHPISAYNNGKTVWGWPSGEDIRETIKFSLAGNKAHLVFSAEGLYTIQVSPCKIRKMKELLDDQERGILIFIIEEYFKSTHNFRGVDEVNQLAKKGIYINPYSYVDFVNTFDLINLLSSKKIVHNKSITQHTKNIGHTGIHGEENINKYSFGDSTFSRIPNIGFPDINVGTIENQPLSKYIKKEDLKELRKIDTKGEEDSFKIKDINVLISKLQDIFKEFDSKQCDIAWNNHKNAWFFVNFFPSNNYREHDYFRNNHFVSPDKNIPITTDIQPFIRIFSNKKEGCTVNEMGRASKFKIGKMTTMGHCNRDSSHFCGFGKNKFGKNKNKNKRYTMPRSKGFSLKTLRKDLLAITSVRRRTRFGGMGDLDAGKDAHLVVAARQDRLNAEKEMHKIKELETLVKNLEPIKHKFFKIKNDFANMTDDNYNLNFSLNDRVKKQLENMKEEITAVYNNYNIYAPQINKILTNKTFDTIMNSSETQKVKDLLKLILYTKRELIDDEYGGYAKYNRGRNRIQYLIFKINNAINN